jgi:hypothetical protein
VTRARDVADVQENLGGPVSPFVAGKNKILNGDFSIWQRGTTLSSGGYLADRMLIGFAGGTQSRQTFTLGTAPVAGYEGQFYLNVTLTANSQNFEHMQKIENARTFAGQTITMSFWARSTVGAQPLNVAIYQNFGTGGSPSSLTEATRISGSSPYTPTSSWQRYSFTFNVPSVSGKTFGTNNDSFLWIRFAQYTTTATNTSLDVWGLQVEAGSVATPFSTATGNYPNELQACKYYFERYTAAMPGQPSQIDVANRPEWMLNYSEKRVAPTITMNNPTGLTWVAITSASGATNASFGGTFVGTATTQALLFFSTASGISAYTFWVPDGGGSYSIDISAEL